MGERRSTQRRFQHSMRSSRGAHREAVAPDCAPAAQDTCLLAEPHEDSIQLQGGILRVLLAHSILLQDRSSSRRGKRAGSGAARKCDAQQGLKVGQASCPSCSQPFLVGLKAVHCCGPTAAVGGRRQAARRQADLPLPPICSPVCFMLCSPSDSETPALTGTPAPGRQRQRCRPCACGRHCQPR